MRRLKKQLYLGLCAGALLVLADIRACFPGVMESPDDRMVEIETDEPADTLPVAEPEPREERPIASPAPEKTTAPRTGKHPIYSVPSFEDCFPDVQDVQIVAARKWGVKPARNRDDAEKRKSDFVYVGANPYFCIDKVMNASIPYLVPRAGNLLQMIGRNFLDSLYVKDIPLNRIIVTSVLRTEEDVVRLSRRNGNVSDQSCHRFGTTFDICYNRYKTVCPPGEHRRDVTNDTLKWVLSEVLRDIREEGRCYIKYEKKQSCFHITVR